MEPFTVSSSGRHYDITVEEVKQPNDELIRTLIDIDLQTFAESTFSHYMAASFLHHGCVFLLRANGEVIGTCVLARTWDRPNEAVMLSMGIRPGWRGRGLGQRFVGATLDRLQAKGLRAVSLLVGTVNSRAIKLYEEMGFEVTDPEALRDPRTGEAYMRMRRQLRDDAAIASLA